MWNEINPDLYEHHIDGLRSICRKPTEMPVNSDIIYSLRKETSEVSAE